MENTNTVSIPLVDILSELLGKRVVMSGDDYVVFENLEKVSQDKIDEAMILKEQKEKEIVNQNKINEAKNYLVDTCWIWEKYNRNVLVLKDLTEDEFKTKYNDIILKQEECRTLINELEI